MSGYEEEDDDNYKRIGGINVDLIHIIMKINGRKESVLSSADLIAVCTNFCLRRSDTSLKFC